MLDQIRKNADLMFEEVWNKGNVDVLDDIIAPGYVYHYPPYPKVEGLQAFKEWVREIRKIYPDFHVKVDDLLITEERVVSRYTLSGTQTGESPLSVAPPTGKRMEIPGCTVSYLKEGKLVEEWTFADNLGQMQQLGLLPAPGAG
jgi:steroid delta-isomerase-like uncharacterized protein